VAQLEVELGARLFERTTRRMALTEAGHIYLEGARQALMQLQLQLAGEVVEQLQHELRDHPLVHLEVELSGDYVDLVDGGYDLSLRDGPTDLPGVIGQPLLENRILLCASPAYLAGKGGEVTLDHYLWHDWLILRHPLLNRHFWWVLRDEQRTRLDRRCRA
jgi:DNA-binding transcriptional LysR family regulator